MRGALYVAGLLGAAALGGSAYSAAGNLSLDLGRPLAVRSADYVGSVECRRCHAAQYASWRRTFHRTMTQEASAQSVLGDFSGASLRYRGVVARMKTSPQGSYYIEFERGGQRWRNEVVRTVGSHRYQQYLTRSNTGNGDIFWRLPIAWNVEEQRFIHMNGAFLTPDPPSTPLLGGGEAVSREDYDRHVTRWNDNCIYCHNVAPTPGLDPLRGGFDTHVAELGIACEACHGPASEHVARNGDPLRRYALHLGPGRDPTIANPRRLPQERAVEVCGRCHGQRITDDIASVHAGGDPYVPGDNLWDYSRPLTRRTPLGDDPEAFALRFWPDGTPRLTAYEYQGLLQSACFQRGELTCETCHAMHDGEPVGQVRPGREGDRACLACHREFDDDHALSAHTGHEVAGPGSRCRACHMPDIVYGLTGMRISHRIELPDVRRASSAGRPDACTLCHSDRGRAWAVAQQTTGARADIVSGADALPEVTHALLSGDPVERATAAHALGRPDSPAALPPRVGLLLDTMQADDYPAVRAIAWRALQRLVGARLPHGLSNARFVPTDDADERQRAIAAIRELLPIAPQAPDPALLAWLRPRAAQVAIHIGE